MHQITLAQAIKIAFNNPEILKELKRLALKEREKAIDEHDCHLSPEDGCDCSKFYQ